MLYSFFKTKSTVTSAIQINLNWFTLQKSSKRTTDDNEKANKYKQLQPHNSLKNKKKNKIIKN